MQIEPVRYLGLSRSENRAQVWLLYVIVVFICTMISPAVLASYGYPPVQIAIAGVLLSLCLYPAAVYWVNKDDNLPVFPILCLAYGLQFALPVVTRDATVMLSGGQLTNIDDEDIVACLLLSILGVLSLIAGYYGLRSMKIEERIPVLVLPLDPRKAIVYSVIMGIGMPLIASFDFVSSGQNAIEFSAIIRVILNQILVAIAVLSGLVFSFGGNIRTKIVLFGILFLAVVRGMATGFLEHAVTPFAVLLMMRWQYTKKIPLVIIGISLLLIVFLSPVKQDYRTALRMTTDGEGSLGETAIEKMWYWFTSANDYWADALTGQQSFKDSAETAASRLDLIHQFAHVYSMTPSIVPYQYGATYSYFLVALIPRVIWPDKPEAGSANYFYAVSYNITTEDGARRSTFGMSLLTESFINFGWIGVIIIMALQGAFLYSVQVIFSGAKSGLGGQAVFVAFFVFFLNGIGSSAEIMFGNLIQSLLLSVAFLWVARSTASNLQTLTPVGVRPVTSR
jgi:hypothetical protein